MGLYYVDSGASGTQVVETTLTLESSTATAGQATIDINLAGYEDTMRTVLYVNGIRLIRNVHYSISGSTINLSNNWKLSTGDNVEVEIYEPTTLLAQSIETEVSVATGGETTIAITTEGYNDTMETILYINGIRLIRDTHYSVSGTTITLSNNWALTANDNVEIVIFT
jgi:hypothetical protein